MDFDNNLPIYVQVIQELKREMVTGGLKLGDKLPSTRELALKYQINPNTASRIYKEMEIEKLCFTKRGLGTFMTEDGDRMKEIREEMAEILLEKFIKGMKDLGLTKEEIIKLIETKYE